MGLGGSKESTFDGKLPELLSDKVSPPKWAQSLPADSPVVFFDITINEQSYGRIEMTLAQSVVPKT